DILSLSEFQMKGLPKGMYWNDSETCGISGYHAPRRTRHDDTPKTISGLAETRDGGSDDGFAAWRWFDVDSGAEAVRPVMRLDCNQARERWRHRSGATGNPFRSARGVSTPALPGTL